MDSDVVFVSLPKLQYPIVHNRVMQELSDNFAVFFSHSNSFNKVYWPIECRIGPFQLTLYITYLCIGLKIY